MMGNYQVLGSVFLTNFYPIHLHHHHRKDLHSSPILSSHFRIHHYLVPNLSCLRSCYQNHFSQCSIKLTQFNVNLFVMNFKTSSLTSLHWSYSHPNHYILGHYLGFLSILFLDQDLLPNHYILRHYCLYFLSILFPD
ncbi:hypothetical protein V8G54_026549 [Vigna mungo]|uniref:Uncharacterized protein n=1 Tax=Vigna mungo TaxID=3915 RepID=A0AAQ3MYZ0_VIGMU